MKKALFLLSLIISTQSFACQNCLDELTDLQDYASIGMPGLFFEDKDLFYYKLGVLNCYNTCEEIILKNHYVFE